MIKLQQWLSFKNYFPLLVPMVTLALFLGVIWRVNNDNPELNRAKKYSQDTEYVENGIGENSKDQKNDSKLENEEIVEGTGSGNSEEYDKLDNPDLSTDERSEWNKSREWWEYPELIKESTRSGDDLLVLVNKEYALPSTYSPSDLAKIDSNYIRTNSNQYIRVVALSDLYTLAEAAYEEGIDLSVISSYRSYTDQVGTYQYWVGYNGGSEAAADTISARPGHSQHQLGTAIDFSTNEISDQIVQDQNGKTFQSTSAGLWLADNAWKYGFVLSYPEGKETVTGYAYESWHYRYIGVDNALRQHNSGLTLEEWLK